MNTVKVLAIGNSFSTDATRYLHQLAQSAGIDLYVANLYVPSCTLEMHWKFMERHEAAYVYEVNGYATERKISLEEALEMEKWDHVVNQQASAYVGWLDSYEPFLGILLDKIRSKVPAAKLYLHETWAFEIGYGDLCFMRYHRSQQNMYERLNSCYKAMAEKYDLQLIPSGTTIQRLRNTDLFYVPGGGRSLCRDGRHVSLDYGRYLLACVWLKSIMGISMKDITFVPDDPNLTEVPDKELLRYIRDFVDQV